MVKYAAFLQGINNAGGGKKVKMEKLRETLDSINLRKVTTLLNSGNIVFETNQVNSSVLTKRISQALREAFGFEIKLILRSGSEISSLNRSNPFKNIKVTPDTRLYVTFLPKRPKSKLKIPYKSKAGNIRILGIGPREIYSVVILSQQVGTAELMHLLAKEFGKNITTRNWNTVMKMVKALEN
jgi:uncharacterized protein (DUF1697 family)